MGACRALEGGGLASGRYDDPRRGARAPHNPAQPPLPPVRRSAGHRGGDAAPHRARRPRQAPAGRSPAEHHDAEGSMSYEWGRAPESGKWQRAVPVWFMSVILLALASGIGVWWVRQAFVWTPLQQFYLSAYARSALASSLAIRTGRYRLLLMENRRGSRLAIDEEVVPISTPAGETNFALSDLARQAGSGRLAWRDLVVNHAKPTVQLTVYTEADQTLTDLARPSLITAVVVWIAGLLIAIPKDVKWSRSRRHGRRLKGPELVSVRQFNRRPRADGISFMQTPRLSAKLLGLETALAIPRAIESTHLLIMGDSGTGKSALIRQLLGQLEDRGDSAIVYDPALEYTSQFYTRERGDVVLNPLDARSPYWSPVDELRHEAEALTLATSLFPDRVNENPFFTEGPRRIFAHLFDVPADRRGTGLVALPRPGTRSPCPRHTLRVDHRPTSARAAQRCVGGPQHGRRHAEAAPA